MTTLNQQLPWARVQCNEGEVSSFGCNSGAGAYPNSVPSVYHMRGGALYHGGIKGISSELPLTGERQGPWSFYEQTQN